MMSRSEQSASFSVIPVDSANAFADHGVCRRWHRETGCPKNQVIARLSYQNLVYG